MAQKVVVYHRGYGCETGCCGHTVELFEESELAKEDFDPHYSKAVNESDSDRNFEFNHPWGESEQDKLEFAKALVIQAYGEDHVKDLDWDHCIVTDNCM